MDISIQTPALLFPAITLLMLAYTNRFLGLAKLIRDLHTKYKNSSAEHDILRDQIKNLQTRLNLIRQMQFTGVLSFFLCVVCMLLIYFQQTEWALVCFAASLFVLLYSLVLSLREITISTKALEIELKNMEELKD
jgi:hypothetical protein